MPLDSLTYKPETMLSMVERTQIVPVPMATLRNHKDDTLAALFKVFPGRKGLAQWREFSQPRYSDALAVAEELTRSATPRGVRELAKAAEEELRKQGAIEVHQVVGWMDPDPYLCLNYRNDTERGTICLAIWEGKTILHRARVGKPRTVAEAIRRPSAMMGWLGRR